MASGRKRKPGKRERNGRPARAPLPDPRAHALLWPSRRHLADGARLDQKAATPLGGLNILGIITNEEYEAGVRFAGIVMRYRAVIEAPNPAPGGIDSGGRGYIPDDEAERRKAAYDAAYEAFNRIEPRKMRHAARKWTRAVAVYDEDVGDGLESLRAGLSALAVHFLRPRL